MDYISNSKEVNTSKAKMPLSNNKKFVFSIFNLATFIMYFNLQFLPSSVRALEMTLALSPTDVTSFMMAESLGLVTFIPIWGALSDKIELKYIMLFGVTCSGIISIWLGGISNFTMIMILRVFNGALMGSVTPSSQKYVMNHLYKYFGIAFGLVHAVMCAARMFSSVIVTKLSTQTIFGLSGWRVCLFGFGGLTFLLSPIILLIPKLNNEKTEKTYELVTFENKIKRFVKYICHMVKESLNNSTSILMVFLSFFSDGPFVSFNFVTLLIQYMALSDLMSGVTTGLVIVGGIIGGIMGGFLSDYFNRKSPKYGLLILGEINLIVRIISFSVSFSLTTVDTINKLYPLLAVCLIINGMTFMTVSCVDRPIIANVVVPSFHSSAISIIRCISGVASTLIFNPVLSKLRDDAFGFEKTTLEVKNMSKELLRKNSDALRYSIISVSVGTTVVVFILYLILMYTYGRDFEKVKKRVEMESMEEPSKIRVEIV